jgi:hypothetical protein
LKQPEQTQNGDLQRSAALAFPHSFLSFLTFNQVLKKSLMVLISQDTGKRSENGILNFVL